MNCIFVLLIFSSIVSYHNKQDTISIDVSLSKKIPLDKIVDSARISYLKIPDSTHIGYVNTVKECGDYLIVSSEHNTNSLICFKKGDFLYHLSNIGSGPGEYTSLFGYYVDTLRNNLVVYDRGQLKLIYYELDTGKYKNEKKINLYLSNIELLGTNTLIMSTDYMDGKASDYVLVTDTEFLRESTSLLKTTSQLVRDAVFPSSFSISNGDLLFVEPFSEIVYKLDSTKITPLFKIDFPGKKFPEKYLDNEDADYVEDQIHKGDFAFLSHLFVPNSNFYSFFYHRDIARLELALVDKNNSKSSVLTNVSQEFVGDNIPVPQTFNNGRYIYVVHKGEIDLEPGTFWSDRIDPDQMRNSAMIAIYFTFKLP